MYQDYWLEHRKIFYLSYHIVGGLKKLYHWKNLLQYETWFSKVVYLELLPQLQAALLKSPLFPSSYYWWKTFRWTQKSCNFLNFLSIVNFMILPPASRIECPSLKKMAQLMRPALSKRQSLITKTFLKRLTSKSAVLGIKFSHTWIGGDTLRL